MIRGSKRRDELLVRRVLAGNREDYAVLVQRHLPTVHAVAYARTGNRADAEDVAQESFLNALLMLDKLRDARKFGAWVARIARNTAYDLIKKRKRETESLAKAQTAAEQGGDSGMSHAENREMRALVQTQIEQLEEASREVLLLHYFAGKSTNEIAELLEISPAACRKRLQRAREALGQHILRELGVSEEDQSALQRRGAQIMSAAVALPVSWQATAAGAVASGTLLESAVAIVSAHKAVLAAVVMVAATLGFMARHPSQTQEAETPQALDRAATPPISEIPPKPVSPVIQAAVTPASAPMKQGDVTLRGPGVVWGAVIGPDDRPLAQTKAILVPEVHACSVYVANPEAPLRLTAVTDESGQFRFPHLPLGRCSVTTTGPGPSAAAGVALLDEDFPETQLWLELEPAGSISGRVIADDEQPIPNALIFPYLLDGDKLKGWDNQAYLMPFVTDSSGAFSFEALPHGDWQFVVKVDGWANCLTEPIEAGSQAVEIVLTQGGRVSGQVIEAESLDPLSGVQVSLERRAASSQMQRMSGPNMTVYRMDVRPWPESAEVETGADGRFTAAGLPEGEYTVHVAGAYLNATKQPVTCTVTEGEATTDVSISALLGGSIAGRVYRAGSDEGISGVKVQALLGERNVGRATTDDTGRYELEGLWAETYVIRHQYAKQEERRQCSVALGERVANVDFQFKQAHVAASGIVVDAEQRPMAGVKIVGFGQIECLLPREALTAADGSFRLTGLEPAGHFWIRASKEGWVAADYTTSLGEQNLDHIRLVMHPPARMSGKVVDKAGRPVEALSLFAYLGNASLYTSRSSSTTGGGRFAFPRLVPGPYRFVGQLEGAQPVTIGEVELAPGQELTDLRLTYGLEDPGLTISGSVMDVSGKPLAGVLINAEGPGNDVSGIHTDGSGRYSMSGLKEGFYEVRAYPRDHSNGVLDAVAAGAQDADFYLDALGSVEGSVVSADTRQPVPGFQVALLEGIHDSLNEYARHDSIRVSDATGRFAFKKVQAGTHTLAAWTDQLAPAFEVVEIPGGTTVSGIVLQLSPRVEVAGLSGEEKQKDGPETAMIDGVVLDRFRSPVANAAVFLSKIPHHSNRPAERVAHSGPDGRFRAENVPIDVTRIFAIHPDHAPGGASVALRSRMTQRATIVLPQTGAVHGIVRRGGRPLANEWVNADYHILDKRGYENAHTAFDGSYEIAGLPPGEGTVRLSLEIGPHQSRTFKHPVLVQSGRTAQVDFDLLSGDAAIEGVLLLDDEPTQGSLFLSIRDADGLEERSEVNTTGKGRFWIGNLPAGTINLEAVGYASGRKKRTTTVSVETVSGQVVYQEISLDQALSTP